MLTDFFSNIVNNEFLITDSNFNNETSNDLVSFFENTFFDHLFLKFEILTDKISSTYNEFMNNKLFHSTFLNLIQSDNFLNEIHEKRNTDFQKENTIVKTELTTNTSLLEPTMNNFYLEDLKKIDEKNVTNQILHNIIDEKQFEESENLFNFIIKTINSHITFSNQVDSLSSHFINNGNNDSIFQILCNAQLIDVPIDFDKNNLTNYSEILNEDLSFWSQNNIFQLEHEKNFNPVDRTTYNEFSKTDKIKEDILVQNDFDFYDNSEIIQNLPFWYNLNEKLDIHQNSFFDTTNQRKPQIVATNNNIFFNKELLDLDFSSQEIPFFAQQEKLNQNFDLVKNYQNERAQIQTLQNENMSTMLNSNYLDYDISSRSVNFISSYIEPNTELDVRLDFSTPNKLELEHTTNPIIQNNSLQKYENNFQESNMTYLNNSLFSLENNAGVDSSSNSYDLTYNFQHPLFINNNKNSSNEKKDSRQSANISSADKNNDFKKQNENNNSQQNNGESAIDIEKLTNQIYEKISEQIQQERDRIGYR